MICANEANKAFFEFLKAIVRVKIAKRITRAKQLLRFTDMTVDEIGAAVGMGDANYFSRTFRKVEGISPSEYRKRW